MADEVIVTQAQNPRAAEPEVVKKFFKNKKPLTVAPDVKKALRAAYSKADKNDLILATGSLFLVGEIKDIVQNAKCKAQN